jgi:hypothetical protein
MAIVNISGTKGHSYQETIATGTNGDSVIVHPLNGKPLTCTLIAGAGTGKIQFTTSSEAAVIAGTATWQDWEGVTTGTGSDVLIGAVTAVRGVSTSGEVKIELVY